MNPTQTLAWDDFPLIYETEFGVVSHELDAEGLTMLSVLSLLGSGKTLEVKLSWTTEELADDNYTKAVESFNKNLAKMAERAARMEDDEADSVKVKRFKRRHFYLFTNRGAPIWLIPRFGVVRRAEKDNSWGIRFGWIYRAYTLTTRKINS